ncbi:RagB/SusD family nutrient uptake outer membrane protein [Pedobacter miscanthi]|uniref:RagB/SusD family nutrient uptake outer membrane protein n=1 Tax=Pedobacter miscanthi TaxID=2259170 RepID=UPI00292D2214|nr:RagB/SusD family nutrient uptake outer membrane protein [Pedobacter miscanthi]
MKLRYIYAAIVPVLLLLSCNKFIDKPYDNRLELKSVGDFEDVVTKAYPERQDMFTDILTDDFHHYAPTMQASNVSRYVPIFMYKDDYEEATATPSRSYAHYYSKIYMANIVIEGVMGSSGNELQKKAVLGEALMLRAYCYFTLTNLFGMHYNPSTNGNNLAVPLITEVPKDNRPTFKRNTVKEVYDQIDKDFAEGLALLKAGESFLIKNPYRFSVASANAFGSRLNLYKGSWDATIKYSNDVLSQTGLTLRDYVKDLAVLTSTSNANFTLEFMNPSTHKNILLASQTGTFLELPVGYRLGGFYLSHNYSLASSTLWNTTDYRRRLMLGVATVIDSVSMYLKYAHQDNQPSVPAARYECFTVEEALINRAEAYMKASTPNVAAAIADMEALRKTRFTPYTALNTAGLTNEQILALILKERRIEFLGQGMRWYDIKRLGIEVEHRLIRYLPATGTILKSNDLRTALQIPLSARIGNPALETQLNPR